MQDVKNSKNFQDLTNRTYYNSKENFHVYDFHTGNFDKYYNSVNDDDKTEDFTDEFTNIISECNGIVLIDEVQSKDFKDVINSYDYSIFETFYETMPFNFYETTDNSHVCVIEYVKSGGCYLCYNTKDVKDVIECFNFRQISKSKP